MFFNRKINLDKYQNIFILTGAGISVASGLKTYREPVTKILMLAIEYSGAKTILINLEPMKPKNHYFQQ